MPFISKTILFLFLLLPAICPAGAEICKWVDEDGRKHYGDCPKAGPAVEQVEVKPGPSAENQQQAQERAEGLDRYLEQIDEESVPEAETEQQETEPASRQEWTAGCFSAPADVLGPGTIEPFEPITPRPLTPAEYRDLSDMFGKLAGKERWTGSMHEVTCISPEHEPPSETRHHQVVVQTTRGQDNVLTIKSELLRVDDKTKSQEVLRLLLKTDRLRVSDGEAGALDEPQWDVEIISVGPGSLEFMREYRESINYGVSTHHLQLRSLQVTNSSLRIKELLYVQGVLAGIRTWTLKK